MAMHRATLLPITLLLLVSLNYAATAKEGTPPVPKPLVVYVFDNACTLWTGKITPIIKELEMEYGERVTFVSLDETAGAKEKTRARAKELGLLSFLADFEDFTPVVAVFDSNHKLVKELAGPKAKTDYKVEIDKVLNKP